MITQSVEITGRSMHAARYRLYRLRQDASCRSQMLGAYLWCCKVSLMVEDWWGKLCVCL